MMSMTKTVIALAVGLCTTHVNKAAEANDPTAARVLRPNQSVAFPIEAKATLSYFTNEDRICKATMWVAAPPTWQANVATFATTKYEADIPVGKSGIIAPAPGKAFAFECQSEARTMTIRPLRPTSLER
ncbi:hypothetical protein [Hyphomicrobium facile]|uniref:Uncharacterized protein n=1 Tax=Hyphomicrobium facile TaxID=51670 RepID=A0A1I7NQG2_9HYPH|nr:hypothetical protein [Hyphomicrobium facile]SFV36820.1 hypothetical protein SAMN04488557_2803 [Hyphomicrobium facile]